jgi:hypothetical protein
MEEDLTMDDRPIDRLSKMMAAPLSRRQTLRLVGGSVSGAALAVAGVAGLSTPHRAMAQGVLEFPVIFEGVLGSFEGLFTVTEFAIQQGQLVALGTLTGDVFDAAGNLLGPIDPLALAIPFLDGISGTTCEILTLVLGPLHLELLGLVVDLNQIVLEITGETGSLLGDLLCSIADLLSGNGGALGRLRNLLNQLLGALGGA